MFNRWHNSPHAKLWCLCSKVIMRSVRGPSGVSKIIGCPVGFIWQCSPHAQHKTCATEVIGGLGVDKVIGLKQAHVLQIPRNAVDLVKPHENITKHTFHKLIKQHQQKSFIIGPYEKASHPWRRLQREPDGALRLMKERGSSGKPQVRLADGHSRPTRPTRSSGEGCVSRRTVPLV